MVFVQLFRQTLHAGKLDRIDDVMKISIKKISFLFVDLSTVLNCSSKNLQSKNTKTELFVFIVFGLCNQLKLPKI